MSDLRIRVITVRTKKLAFEIPDLTLGDWNLSDEATSIQLGADVPSEIGEFSEVSCRAHVSISAEDAKDGLGYTFESESIVGLHVLGEISGHPSESVKKAVATQALRAAHSVYKTQLHQFISAASLDVAALIPFELPEEFAASVDEAQPSS